MHGATCMTVLFPWPRPRPRSEVREVVFVPQMAQICTDYVYSACTCEVCGRLCPFGRFSYSLQNRITGQSIESPAGLSYETFMTICGIKDNPKFHADLCVSPGCGGDKCLYMSKKMCIFAASNEEETHLTKEALCRFIPYL